MVHKGFPLRPGHIMSLYFSNEMKLVPWGFAFCSIHFPQVWTLALVSQHPPCGVFTIPFGMPERSQWGWQGTFSRILILAEGSRNGEEIKQYKEGNNLNNILNLNIAVYIFICMSVDIQTENKWHNQTVKLRCLIKDYLQMCGNNEGKHTRSSKFTLRRGVHSHPWNWRNLG